MNSTTNDRSQRTLKRMTDNWDPAVNPELEQKANELLETDASSEHAILTGRQLKRRRQGEVYSVKGQIDQSAGLFIRSRGSRSETDE